MLKQDVRTNEHLVRNPLHICHWIDDSLFTHEERRGKNMLAMHGIEPLAGEATNGR